MPNWCENEISISNHIETLVEKQVLIKTWEDEYIPNMHSLFPDIFLSEYKELEIVNPYTKKKNLDGSPIMMKSDSFREGIKYPEWNESIWDSEWWYNWNINNLWTKWLPTFNYSHQDNNYSYFYSSTAWSPCNELLKKITEVFFLETENEYEEPGCCFAWRFYSRIDDDWELDYFDEALEYIETCAYCDEKKEDIDYRDDLWDHMCNLCYQEELDTQESNAWIDNAKQNLLDNETVWEW